MFNSTFYPTPKGMISRMLAKIEGKPDKVLEPSAGKGDIIAGLEDKYYRRLDVSAIEIAPDLQATLRGKGVKVLDTDFLAYTGPDKFDLIIANPPFDEGDKHLLKAIEILYRGQIIFLLNAETIRNPHTSTRKLLKQKLEELGAEIEFHKNVFKEAERKTDVEVALVNIKIEREVEDDLFTGVDDAEANEAPEYRENYEVSTGKTIAELVAEYNRVVKVGTDTIVGFYRNFRTVGKYLSLNDADDRHSGYYSKEDLTSRMQGALNQLLVSVRTDFWRRTLDLKEVHSRLTSKKQDEFEDAIKKRTHMDFTENNIRQFVLNLIGGFEKTLTEAVLEIFDLFTRHGYRSESIYEKNIHYFNGWKTNSAFKVGKRVIIPIYGSYGGPFTGWSGKWELDYRAAGTLRDIDIVMNYFDGRGHYISMSNALEMAFSRGENSAVSTYFKVIAYKKGTVHLTFKDMDILRRFNFVACRGKGWLPEDYGSRRYDLLTGTEKAVVDSFEGQESYSRGLGQPLFKTSELLQLGV